MNASARTCNEVVAFREGEKTPPQSTSQEQAFDLQMEGPFRNPKDQTQQEIQGFRTSQVAIPHIPISILEDDF